MKRGVLLSAGLFVLMLYGVCLADEVTTTLSLSQYQTVNVQRPRMVLGSRDISLGKSLLTGLRFEKLQIPKDAVVTSAQLTAYSKQGDNPVTLRYRGEKSINPQRFSPFYFSDLNSRSKTLSAVLDRPEQWLRKEYVRTADVSQVIQEIVSQPKWKSGTAVVLFVEDAASEGVRTVYADKPLNATLEVTYTTAATVTAGATYPIDVNDDGVADFTLQDTDMDGYFELPAGKIEYVGTLILNRPVELMGVSGATRTATIIKGDYFILADGGIIISDLLSPIPSTKFTGLKGTDLQIIAKNGIMLENNGKVRLGGNAVGDLSGDVYLETTRWGAEMLLDGGLSIYGRGVTLLSDGGDIFVQNNARINSCGQVLFRTYGGDINLEQSVSVSASAIGATVSIDFRTEDGQQNLNVANNVFLAADFINACSVKGMVSDDGTTKFIGKKDACWP
jgi:hypothetical protein